MADLPLLIVKILVNPKGLTAFCALIKTKSAHDKLQSIKNAWSKDEICCLEMAALLSQGNSESDKYRFNTAFLTGSDYFRYPMVCIACAAQSVHPQKAHRGNGERIDAYGFAVIIKINDGTVVVFRAVNTVLHLFVRGHTRVP